MNAEEITKVLDLLESAYGVKKFYADTDKRKVIHLWSVLFREDEATEVNRAVVDCISTLQFAPTIADIKMRMAEAKMSGQPTEMEAWAMVRDAVNRSSSRQSATEAFNELPPAIRRCCATPTQLCLWYKLNDEQLETVVASNFQRSYRELARDRIHYYALPNQLQAQQAWRIEAPEQTALPEPEKPKFEKPDWMIRREEMGEEF